MIFGEVFELFVASCPACVMYRVLYQKRWTLEAAFNELTLHLRCELNTLGYPKAAPFAFCVAVCCYNLLASLKGALRAAHGEEELVELSGDSPAPWSLDLRRFSSRKHGCASFPNRTVIEFSFLSVV